MKRPRPTTCSIIPATMSRSSTSRAGQVLCHTWSPTKTAATSKPFWSAAKAPSAELSARDICRPIRASWSSSGGPVVRLHVGKLDAAKTKSATLRNVFARYADCMLAQIFQSTACNAVHSIEQRTAKWIISAMERTDGDNTVPLTHEQLATMLGVGRSYASRVIQTFKAEGVLETRRGSILIRDREALRIRSCLCNEAVKNHFEEVLRGVYPTEEAHPVPQKRGS